MFYSYETMIVLHKWLIFSVIIFFIIDCLLVYLIRKYHIEITNIYWKLQKEFGFIFVLLLKGILIFFLSYLLLNPPGNAGTTSAIAIVYCILVIRLLIDTIKSRKGIRKKKISANSG